MATKLPSAECILHQSITVSDEKYFIYFDIKEPRVTVLITNIANSWRTDVLLRDVLATLKLESSVGFKEFLNRWLQVAVNVAFEGSRLNLEIGTKQVLKLELNELLDSGKVLFEVLENVSQQCHKVEKNCDTLQLKVSRLESDFLKSDTNSVPLPTRSKGRQTKIRKPEGASLINPSSKRKKVAKGATFDD